MIGPALVKIVCHKVSVVVTHVTEKILRDGTFKGPEQWKWTLLLGIRTWQYGVPK